MSSLFECGGGGGGERVDVFSSVAERCYVVW